MDAARLQPTVRNQLRDLLVVAGGDSPHNQMVSAITTRDWQSRLTQGADQGDELYDGGSHFLEVTAPDEKRMIMHSATF